MDMVKLRTSDEEILLDLDSSFKHVAQLKKKKKRFTVYNPELWVYLGGSDGKESACNEGDLDSIPGSGRSPREGNGYPLQYSCLENSKDRGA